MSIEVGAVYNNLGTVSTELGDDDKAEEYYRKALSIGDKVCWTTAWLWHRDWPIGWQGGEALFAFRALVSGNLASIYTSKGKYEEVINMSILIMMLC